MKRILIALAPAVLMVLALAAPASAATQVSRYTYSGLTAGAHWTEYSGDFINIYHITASKGRAGDAVLYFVYNIYSTDPVTGATTNTEVEGLATSGFSFTINASLASASVQGTGLPATTRTWDADFNLIASGSTTVDLAAQWTGQGQVVRTIANQTYGSPPGFRVTDHYSSTGRPATVVGTMAGRALTQLESYATLSNVRQGITTISIGR